MGAFTQRLRTETEADAEGPVPWGEGFFDLIPASGPGDEDHELRFEQIVRQLALEVQKAN